MSFFGTAQRWLGERWFRREHSRTLKSKKTCRLPIDEPI